jgi:hypothetical protein
VVGWCPRSFDDLFLGGTAASHSSVWGEISFLILVVVRLYRVSETEEHLMTTLDVLFRKQVVNANQSTFCALAPFNS